MNIPPMILILILIANYAAFHVLMEEVRHVRFALEDMIRGAECTNPRCVAEVSNR